MSPALIPTQKSPCEPSSSAQDGTMLSSSISSVTCDSPAASRGLFVSAIPDLLHHVVASAYPARQTAGTAHSTDKRFHVMFAAGESPISAPVPNPLVEAIRSRAT